MNAVLGVDAAWTAQEPSGVSLIRRLAPGSWECVAVAPSYASFVELANGNNINWEARPGGGLPQPCLLLQAAAALLGDTEVTVVAVDMPLSRQPIVRRRACDNAISRAFGALGCGTHTPSPQRPGAVSANLMAKLNRLDYPLKGCAPTVANDVGLAKSTIEVYPHPAIVRLLGLNYRLAYKVARSRRLWPNATVPERIDNLRASFQLLHTGLAGQIIGIPGHVVPAPAPRTLSALKRYEDALDALVCAWIGARYLEGHAECFGDANAAIWVPS